jgi:hypothetical protein
MSTGSQQYGCVFGRGVLKAEMVKSDPACCKDVCGGGRGGGGGGGGGGDTTSCILKLGTSGEGCQPYALVAISMMYIR